MLDQYLYRIAHTNLIKRREGLLKSLKGIHVPYEIHKERVEDHQLVNISVPMHHDEMPYILVITNYDNAVGSPGANSNAAAVAISLAILRVFHFIRGRKQQPLPLEFAFVDGHHQHMLGSEVYARTVDPNKLNLVINLDLCGIGDMVLLAAGAQVADTPAAIALNKLQAASHLNFHMLDILPPSNEMPFEALKVPTITACIAPEEDIAPIFGVAVSMRNDEQVALLPNVYEGIQHPERDVIETVNINAMRQVMLIVNTLISNMLNVIKADWK